MKSACARPKLAAAESTSKRALLAAGGAQGSALSSVEPGGQAKPGLQGRHTLLLFARGKEE
jgi:hypothetical protein